ncbi:MAG TPA: type II secretion system F family protein [Pirellulales bacterium]|nr:type II secretion system F family protein [Pirellulales bacterium]
MIFAAGLIDFETLLPFAVFGMFALGAWWVLDRVASGRSRAVERLDELKNPSLRRRKSEEQIGVVKKADAMTRVLAMASPALARPLQPKSELEVSKLKMRMANAGFRNEAAPSIFLGLKGAGLLAGLMLGGVTLVTLSEINQKSLMTALFFAGLLFYLPELVLWFITKRRKESIFLALPDALDLMVVCVEAGLGLDQAMRKVAEEMKSTYKVIAEEFGLANFQLQVGRAKAEVLHELGIRSGVDDLRSLAAILIQADKFGSSIAQALRVQSDSMRTRRRQLAEEKAAKTAVKLIFPLVIFIFPGIFVVLVGPAAITMVRDMFPMMEVK